MSRVVLDPGHGGALVRGGATPFGAVGPAGAREKDLTLALAREVVTCLGGHVSAVELTRDGDVAVSLAARAAAGCGADAFVSLHFNAAADPRAQGHETWHHEHAPEDSVALARAVQAALRRRVGYRDRGVRGGPLAVLDPRRLGATPGCLVELSFLSDPAEERRLGDPAHLRRLAAAVAEGLGDALPRHGGATDVWHEVPLVPQLTGMSCWAAAAAMLIGWRDCVDVDPAELARGSGRWREYQIGIAPDDIDTLARVWDFEVIDGRKEMRFDELAEVLHRRGPLWVGEASPGLHVVVVAGVRGDGDPERSFVRIADPWPEGRGERYTITFAEFRRSLAAAAAIAGQSAKILHNRRGRR